MPMLSISKTEENTLFLLWQGILIKNLTSRMTLKKQNILQEKVIYIHLLMTEAEAF